METTKENVPFLLACTWLMLMHLAESLTRRRNVLCFRPFHQLNLLISFLKSVLNLMYVFFSLLSLRQNSLLWSSLQLLSTLPICSMNLYSFCWLNVHWREVLHSSQRQIESIWWFFIFSLCILEKRECRNFSSIGFFGVCVLFFFFLRNHFNYLHVWFWRNKWPNIDK